MHPLRWQTLPRQAKRDPAPANPPTRNDSIMMFSAHSTQIRRIAHGAYRVAFAVAVIAAGEACAQSAVQGVPNAMQGFSQNRDQPIQIEAATLEMRDKKKEATFAGNVKAAAKPAPIQSATPGPGGSSSIKRLEAKGSVVVTQKDQVVTGETAVFDTRANLITMLGGVVLTQCKNVLRGDRLLVDMTTGVSRVESDNGKVQGLFIQSQGCGPAATGSQTPLPSVGAPNKPK